MKVMKCDRCGNYYEPYSGKKVFPKSSQSNTVKLCDVDEDGIWNEMKSYDFCPVCMISIFTILGVKKDD